MFVVVRGRQIFPKCAVRGEYSHNKVNHCFNVCFTWLKKTKYVKIVKIYMLKNNINQICYSIICIFIFGCISKDQLKNSDFENKLQPELKEYQHIINNKNEPCQLKEHRLRPSWIDKLPKSNRQLFGMGAAPKQTPVSKQVQAAKVLAMNNISQQINVHVKSLYQEIIKSNQAPDIQSLTKLKAEALLKGVKIEQWNDVSTCVIYMLASVDIDINGSYSYTILDSFKQDRTQRRIDFIKPVGLISNIKSEGSCVIHGISPRQAEIIALQRARAAAIDKASEIEIDTTKYVINSMLALDFIRSCSRGYIVNEKVNWHDVRKFQRNPKTSPVLEHHVSIVTDVYIPQKKHDTNTIDLEASLNQFVYNKGESAVLRIKTPITCQVALFNIQANDRIVMLFPNRTVFSHQAFEMSDLYPEPLPEEQSSYEALFICAYLDDSINFQSLFSVEEDLEFTEFFKRYSTVSDKCTDILIPYQVVSVKK